MKKAALLTLTLAVCAGNSTSMEAYSRTTTPWSKTSVALSSAAVGAVTWLVTYFSMRTAGDVALVNTGRWFTSVTKIHVPAMPVVASSVVASIMAAVATGVCSHCFSSYTAQGYAHAAEMIMSGEKCSQPEVLELVQKSCGDAQELADSVVHYFAAQKNELAEAVDALESLFNQLSLANHYFDVAKKGMDDANADLMVGMQDILAAQCLVIKDASMAIKAKPTYEAQCNAALQERSVSAQFATANAIREAGYASRVNYNYNIH